MVLEFVPHQDFRVIYPTFNTADIKHYMRELFSTLNYIHSQGIMHRDIKPHNVLINHSKRTLKVVDFGLADFYFPDRDYSSKVASLYYKAPELLLGSVRYDYSVDVWAAGMILAGLVNTFARFRCSNELQLCREWTRWIRSINCRDSSERKK